MTRLDRGERELQGNEARGRGACRRRGGNDSDDGKDA